MAMKNLLIIALMALMLPVTAQYAAATFLLWWWMWRCWVDRKTPPVLHNISASQRLALRDCFRPAVYATLVHMFLTTFAAVIAYAVTDTGQGRTAAIETYHLVAKQGLLGLVLVAAISRAYALNFRLPNILRPVVVYLCIYTIYLILQRYTGVDWVKGFTGVLPENREAYGVYRLSGFMGHPLSLAYNMVLGVLLFACGGHLALREGRSRAHYWICLALLVFGLAISGSRWPFVVAIVLLLGSNFMQIFAKWRLLLAGILVFAIFLYFEGSFVGRMQEMFAGSVPLTERFPRLLFWQVHWHIFVDHPFVGAGFGATEAVRLDYYVANGYTNIEHKFPAHNIFLQTLADSGLIGLMSLMIWLTGFLVSLRRAADQAKIKSIMLILPAVILTGLFQNNLRDTEFLYAFWLCFVLLICEACATAEYSLQTGNYGRTGQQRIKDRQSEQDQPYSRSYLSGQSAGSD